MLTIDYETEGIVGNPVYRPPKPVGVSIKVDGEPSKYYAWGHPTGNNSTFEDGRSALRRSLEEHGGYLAHNSPFESAITREYMGWETADPLAVHDTQYDLFLYNPYASTFALKPS